MQKPQLSSRGSVTKSILAEKPATRLVQRHVVSLSVSQSTISTGTESETVLKDVNDRETSFGIDLQISGENDHLR